MQERSEEGGHVYRQFMADVTAEKLRSRQLTAYQRAVENPRTHSVFQRKVGRNELCPCGSNQKFKKCCISKVNKGEERVA